MDAPCSQSGALRRNPDMKWLEPRILPVRWSSRSCHSSGSKRSAWSRPRTLLGRRRWCLVWAQEMLEDAAGWLEKATELLAMNPRSAAQMALRAQALAEMAGSQQAQGSALLVSAQISLHQGKSKAARTAAQRACRLFKQARCRRAWGCTLRRGTCRTRRAPPSRRRGRSRWRSRAAPGSRRRRPGSPPARRRRSLGVG